MGFVKSLCLHSMADTTGNQQNKLEHEIAHTVQNEDICGADFSVKYFKSSQIYI